ncbi:tektin-2 isoform X2 [Phascolarctos cinereus]|uniref:Tektin n=1 Tax=Phascolarctos cinereus TaxID=38626 RepID=A0A6P5K2V3_PHACI|nr:tektin-2 isoform X2 [Phascolarctos cinereus]
MAILSIKPGQRFRLPDWHINSYLLSSNAEQQRDASHQIRQECRILRNETNNQTIWDEHDNQTRLSERIDSVDRWKEILDKCLTDIDAEIDAMTQMKEAAERALQAKNLPLDVAIECLTLRESRRDIDVVKDFAEDELHKEVEVIDCAKEALQQKIREVFEQLCLLQEARQQLNSDHRGKMEALEIDRVCLSLNVHSPNISLKVNPTHIPNGSCTIQQWDEYSHYNKDRAEAERKASADLREATALTIAETLEEIAELEEDIRRLEEDLRVKMKNLKLAHTRLETRTYRPSMEMCRDQVQYGLTDEVHQLEATIATLKQKLAQSQDALDALYKHLARIQADIACKSNSLLLDNKCLDTRRKLTVPAEKFVPESPVYLSILLLSPRLSSCSILQMFIKCLLDGRLLHRTLFPSRGTHGNLASSGRHCICGSPLWY